MSPHSPSSTPSPPSAFSFLPQGAIIQTFAIAGHNIVLNFPSPHFYHTHNTAYFSETIGRTTNRIGGAVLHKLNGKTYRLAPNEPPNTLHGGWQGWGKKTFEGPRRVSRDDGRDATLFTYRSLDGEERYPGTVECRVWYTESLEEEGKVELEVEYEVEMVGDECEETVVGVTNHSYFTLNPFAPTIAGTVVTLSTNQHLELDPTRIPTGRILPHPSLPPPLTPFTLGSLTPHIDDCLVLLPAPLAPESQRLDTRPLPLRLQCKLSHPATALNLEIWSTEPAFQFYTGDLIDVPELEDKGAKVPARGARAGIAVEPSRFVNCAGREEWRGMCLLGKGQVWGARNVYRAWKR